MNFVSTRGSKAGSFIEAFNKGLAEDGGLFLPESFPSLSDRLDSLAELTYPELVAEFMYLFASEIDREEWSTLAKKAYSEFSVPDAVNVHQLKSVKMHQTVSCMCLNYSTVQHVHSKILHFNL